MTKTANLHLRLEPAERAALEAAAREDDRSVSQLARRIISEWLAKHAPQATNRAA
jgi:uncharacterized protein (DUF1778 family)